MAITPNQLRSEVGKASLDGMVQFQRRVFDPVDAAAVLVATSPATPDSNTLYKHRNAGGHMEIPLTAADVDAAIAGVLTAAQGGIAAGALEGWHEVGAASEPGFSNSWAWWGAGHTTPAFRKHPSGLVEIKGLLAGGTINAAAFTLPAGYRPAVARIFAAVTDTGLGRLDINSIGTVVPVSGGTSFFSINCSFYGDA